LQERQQQELYHAGGDVVLLRLSDIIRAWESKRAWIIRRRDTTFASIALTFIADEEIWQKAIEFLFNLHVRGLV
jgi:hypothetical protein